jgi:hypothetical protein
MGTADALSASIRGTESGKPEVDETPNSKNSKANRIETMKGPAESGHFNETKEALERQTATSEILSVISSSPSDTQPVFDAIVRSGLKLFPDAAIMIALADGVQVKAAAVADSDPARAEALRRRFPIPLTRDYMNGVAILDARVVDIPDATKAPPGMAAGIRNFLTSGYRAATNMPMLRGDAAIGVLSVNRLAPGPLTEKQQFPLPEGMPDLKQLVW